MPSSNASATKYAHRAASSVHVGPVEPNASVGGGGVDADAERVDAGARVAVGRGRAPANRVAPRPPWSPWSAHADDAPAVDRTAAPESLRPSAENTSIARGVIVTVWSKRSTTALGGEPSVDCVAGETCRQASRGRTPPAGKSERRDATTSERLSHRGPPANSERCPKIGATSRSQNSITARTIQVIANPALQAKRRGWSAWPRGKIAATRSVHPIAWWRNAAREKNHGFCSWMRNAAALTRSVNAEGQRPPPARQLSADDARAGSRRPASRPRPTRRAPACAASSS